MKTRRRRQRKNELNVGKKVTHLNSKRKHDKQHRETEIII